MSMREFTRQDERLLVSLMREIFDDLPFLCPNGRFEIAQAAKAALHRLYWIYSEAYSLEVDEIDPDRGFSDIHLWCVMQQDGWKAVQNRFETRAMIRELEVKEAEYDRYLHKEGS